ncbi:hypothetical protein TcasGA2_TC032804 [Tribolium castaneum]|uniref:Uncharacterized protein n=1 Tax=Tribolium castaneum TaxID=7070 RepID=A0A139WIU0_TRICA|nr:hypothetical protein TcasGA2_TC032804 [Tribolium castaneum]
MYPANVSKYHSSNQQKFENRRQVGEINTNDMSVTTLSNHSISSIQQSFSRRTNFPNIHFF